MKHVFINFHKNPVFYIFVGFSILTTAQIYYAELDYQTSKPMMSYNCEVELAELLESEDPYYVGRECTGHTYASCTPIPSTYQIYSQCMNER